MVKIYTHYSNSHRILYENYFKFSLRTIYTKEQLPIRVTHHIQTTETGSFMSDGWLDTMDMKLDVILKAIDENKDGWFIFADCDVQFFKPFVHDLESELKDVDIVAQNDCGTLCAGFFACKSNEKTKLLFNLIKFNFKSMVNDQVALNKFSDRVNFKLLDTKKYYTIGNFFDNPEDGTHVWDNTTQIFPPNEMLVHHANYVKGVYNKIKLLETIKKNFNYNGV